MRAIDADAFDERVRVAGGMSEEELTEDFKDGVQAVLYMLSNQPTIQPEIIRCKDCKYWVPGYITDNDDFIPPKCGEWQQMVGHSSDDYCSLAERREETT